MLGVCGLHTMVVVSVPNPRPSMLEMCESRDTVALHISVGDPNALLLNTYLPTYLPSTVQHRFRFAEKSSELTCHTSMLRDAMDTAGLTCSPDLASRFTVKSRTRCSDHASHAGCGDCGRSLQPGSLGLG